MEAVSVKQLEVVSCSLEQFPHVLETAVPCQWAVVMECEQRCSMWLEVRRSVQVPLHSLHWAGRAT